MPRLFSFLLTLALGVLPFFGAEAKTQTVESYYARAFAVVEKGNATTLEKLIEKGPDPILNKVLRGYAMALPGNHYSFKRLDHFMRDNPAWPGLRDIQMIAEQKISRGAKPGSVVTWFTNHPSIMLEGFYRNIDALQKLGQKKKALALIRERWVEDNFSRAEQADFYKRFSSALNDNDMWNRTDRLLWDDQKSQVRRMFPYLNTTKRLLATARLEMAHNRRGASFWLSRVPEDARNDPGLIYLRLKHAVKHKDDKTAYALLLNPPASLGQPEAWWSQRAIMIRRAIEEKQYALAYRLASQHGQTSPRTQVDAEFMSGWLALRFLKRPDLALGHFQALYDTASTPISRARGAYWLGRSYEVLGNKLEAEQAYEDAAVSNTTFYGQLALTRIYAAPTLTAQKDPAIPEAFRTAFFNRDNIRAILRLTKIGQKDQARTFFLAATEAATKRSEFVLLTDVATLIHRPDLGILAVKAANQKNMLVQNGGFPLISTQLPDKPEQAFIHSLIRQESLFNPKAISPAGARGLMQLMPHTARDICQKIGLKYKKKHLHTPEYNVQIGTSFVAKQLKRFDGSYILALASYNAGPNRVRNWMDVFGDPRSPHVDPIDWIELIPVPETRNYIQRIIESLQVYRAKLAGGKSRLLIIKDLKR
ncbi:MAG: lytic transglycosylase domain-containing protein [Alphaproteobacteria bacterium]|nr:lytic transglycosylase domain-containing protein [Alphaproteobacteria bacterium]